MFIRSAHSFFLVKSTLSECFSAKVRRSPGHVLVVEVGCDAALVQQMPARHATNVLQAKKPEGKRRGNANRFCHKAERFFSGCKEPPL